MTHFEKTKCHKCGKVPSLYVIKGKPMCKACIDKEWEASRPKPTPIINKNKQHPYEPIAPIPLQVLSPAEAKKEYTPSINMFLLTMIRRNEDERERLRKENDEIRAFLDKIK